MNPRGSKSFGRAGIPCNMEREGEKWEMMGGGGGKFCRTSYVILSHLGFTSKANKNSGRILRRRIR